MKWIRGCVMVLVCSLALQACGKNSPASVSPSASAGVADADAAADGSTLKVTAPEVLSPINTVLLEDTTVTMVSGPSVGVYAAEPVAYHFELYDPNEVRVRQDIINGVRWTVSGL